MGSETIPQPLTKMFCEARAVDMEEYPLPNGYSVKTRCVTAWEAPSVPTPDVAFEEFEPLHMDASVILQVWLNSPEHVQLHLARYFGNCHDDIWLSYDAEVFDDVFARGNAHDIARGLIGLWEPLEDRMTYGLIVRQAFGTKHPTDAMEGYEDLLYRVREQVHDLASQSDTWAMMMREVREILPPNSLSRSAVAYGLNDGEASKSELNNVELFSKACQARKRRVQKEYKRCRSEEDVLDMFAALTEDLRDNEKMYQQAQLLSRRTAERNLLGLVRIEMEV